MKNRLVYNMNFDWKFHDGDIVKTGFECVHDTRFDDPTFLKAGNCGVGKWGYNDELWDNVSVPHDFRVYRGEYDPVNIPEPEGFLTVGIVWYRKSFYVDKSHEGSNISFEFDGVYRDCEIYVNGHFVGRHLSGYTSFDFEVSDVILYDQPNVIAVKVDAEKFEGWWYEAAGIYRDVRMVITNRIHVIKDGVFIRTYLPEDSSQKLAENQNIGGAELIADVEIGNDGSYEGPCDVRLRIKDPKGTLIQDLAYEVYFDAYEAIMITFEGQVDEPKLWDVDRPEIYTYQVVIEKDEEVIDDIWGTFGIKVVDFTGDRGVILNGRQLKIQGVCVHDDFAAVGGAMSESVIRHKIQVLKDAGCNAYRCSHNPPSPHLLKACDELGVLVMDEVRLMSTADEYLIQMESLFRRDRNNPSVFIWSIGNEEMNIHGTPTGVKIGKRLQRIAHELDDTRPVTYANNANWNDITRFHEANDFHIDVMGFNYYCMRQFDMYDGIHRDFPDRCILGTENGSGQSTRGQYLPREEELNPAYYSEREKTTSIWANPKRKYNVSAYTESYPLWGSTPLETLKAADKDYVGGYFVWTGFDYRGEIFPFTWPSTIARYGIIDICGFLKDAGHQYRVHWTKEARVHMFPHWTFDCIGEEIEVVITANTQEIEFICNGQSFGRKQMDRYGSVHYFVPYEPGEIIAIAYNDGIEVARDQYKTASQAAKVNLEVVSKLEPSANGEDTIMVKVNVLDTNGVEVASADTHIDFTIEGEGEIVGCGNGDPLCHDHDHNHYRDLFNGLALVVLKTTRKTGEMTLTASAKGLEAGKLVLNISKKARDVLAPVVKADAAVDYYDTKDAADGGV